MSILDVVASLATVAASAAAVCALGTWRGQMLAERRAAAADQILTDAYAFEAFFNAVRDPAWAHTVAGRRKDVTDPHLAAYEVVNERLRGRPELHGALTKDQHRMRAIFRSDPIAEIWRIRDDALGTLHTMAARIKSGMRPRDDLDVRLWKTEENDDPLTVRMKAAIANLEAICHPAMDARDSAARSPCDRLLAWLTGWPR